MYDYYGWKVSDQDPGPAAWAKANNNITLQGDGELLQIIDMLPNKRTVIEAGVNYGFSTPMLSKQFDHVHTFDFPNDIFDCFVANMQDRKIENITMHSCGLGAEEVEVGIIDRFQRKKFERGALGTSVVDSSTKLVSEEKPYVAKQKFKIKTLDSLNIQQVDLIVVDTEGYELNVLKGASETIKNYSPVLVLEFSKKGLSQKYGYCLTDLHKYLLKIGYEHHSNLNKVDRVYVRKA